MTLLVEGFLLVIKIKLNLMLLKTKYQNTFLTVKKLNKVFDTANLTDSEINLLTHYAPHIFEPTTDQSEAEDIGETEDAEDNEE